MGLVLFSSSFLMRPRSSLFRGQSVYSSVRPSVRPSLVFQKKKKQTKKQKQKRFITVTDDIRVNGEHSGTFFTHKYTHTRIRTHNTHPRAYTPTRTAEINKIAESR